MEKISTLPKVVQEFDIEFKPSKTFCVIVGCGKIYITCDMTEKGLHKIRMQRTSKLKCSVTMLDTLFRASTFQCRRDIKQAIKDHRENETGACQAFNIAVKSAMKQGKLAAYSCTDAIGRVLERVLADAIP